MEKSNPLFFKKILINLKSFESDQILYIDDSPETLISAEIHGITGILYKDNDQIRKELDKYFVT